jgi:hypothetical protein
MTFTHRTGRLDRDRTMVHGMENSMRVSASVRLITHRINLRGLLPMTISFPTVFRMNWVGIVGRAYSKYVDETTSFFCVVLWK